MPHSHLLPARMFSYSILEVISILCMPCCAQWGLQVNNGPLSTRQTTNIKHESYLTCWGNGWVRAKNSIYGFFALIHSDTWSIFSQILTTDTPWFANEGKVLGAYCDFSQIYLITHTWEWTMFQCPESSSHKVPVMRNNYAIMSCHNTDHTHLFLFLWCLCCHDLS